MKVRDIAGESGIRERAGLDPKQNGLLRRGIFLCFYSFELAFLRRRVNKVSEVFSLTKETVLRAYKIW